MLEDKDIEKRMMNALEERGRRSIDDLAKSTGIDKERIAKALQTLEEEELVYHITLDGTPRFYIAAIAVVKDRPPEKIDAKCPWCGEGGFVNHWVLGAYKRRCKKKPVIGRSIPLKEVKPPLVFEGPAITTTGNMETSWNVGYGIGEVVPSGEKEVEDKIAETMEELGKVSQYNHVRCPRCGTKWKLILTLTYKSPTALLVECPFCRT